MHDLSRAQHTSDSIRLARVRFIVETALRRIAVVEDADADAFLASLRKDMVALNDGVLSFFAQSNKNLAVVIGKAENIGDSAMTGKGGSTAEMVQYVQQGTAAVGVSTGIFDANPLFTAPKQGILGWTLHALHVCARDGALRHSLRRVAGDCAGAQ